MDLGASRADLTEIAFFLNLKNFNLSFSTNRTQSSYKIVKIQNIFLTFEEIFKREELYLNLLPKSGDI